MMMAKIRITITITITRYLEHKVVGRANVSRTAATRLAPPRIPPSDLVAFTVFIAGGAEPIADAEAGRCNEKLRVQLRFELASFLECVGERSCFDLNKGFKCN